MAGDRSNKRVPDEHYYYGLKKGLRRFKVDIANRVWFDLWHHHVDWEDFGDLATSKTAGSTTGARAETT